MKSINESLLYIRKFPQIILILVSQAPVLLCGAWFTMHRQYPTLDTAGLQLYSGIRAYHSWKQEGVFSALHDLYWLREFKPILNPVFAFPALILTGGDIRAAVAVVNLVLLSVFLLFLYKFLRLFLPLGQATLGTCLIGLLPWVVRAGVNYSTELPILAAGMASVYFLFKNPNFTSAIYCAGLGLSLGFAFCLHPVVLAMGLGPAVLIQALLATRSGTLKARDVLMAIPLLVLFSLAIVQPGGFFEHTFPATGMPDAKKKAITATLSLFSVWFALWGWFCAKRKTSGRFFLVVFLAAFMVYFWFLPFMDKLYSWIVPGTISPFLKYCGELRGKTHETIFMDFGKYALAFTSVLILWRSGHIARGKGLLERHLTRCLAVLLPLILIPPVFGAISHNADTRYYYFYFTILYVLGIIVFYCAEEGGIFLGLMRKSYLFLGILNAFIVFQLIFQWNTPWVSKIHLLMGYGTYNNNNHLGIIPNRTAEPALSVALQLLETVEVNHPIVIGYAAHTNINHYELSLICKEKNKDISFDPTWLLEIEDNIDVQLAYMRKTYPYLLIGPCDQLSPMQMTTPWAQRLYDLNLELIRRWQTGRLRSSEFEVLKEISIKDTHTKYLLLKTIPI